MKKLIPCVWFELQGEAMDKVDGEQWMNIYDYSQFCGQYLADLEEQENADRMARARDAQDGGS